ncbi:MAG: OapC/ArvC family zinc-ribbon domain-containing protein [archaeon]
MPHQCTDCRTVFDDGSTEMLSGCPQCGGNTFQYLPDGATSEATVASSETDSHPPDRPDPTESVTQSVGNAARTVRNLVSNDSKGVGTDPTSADPLSPWSETDQRTSEVTRSNGREDPAGETPRRSMGDDEDAAQASARSAVVSPEELPSTGAPEVAAGSPAQPEGSAQSDEQRDRPDLETLRAELNDQFESIRIVEPGQYELNLMELYEREEYIIALQEDGRYRIQVPESW